jgi:teichuronic acid biosynthesis glycosyltransferase TuaC
VRALVVSNMQADAAHPERGSFVRDQVSALRSIDGLDVELYEFPPGAPQLARAALGARRRPAGAGRGAAGAPRGGMRSGLDVVHAHFGLSAWPALAVRARVRALTVHGTDVQHPRTRLATAAVLPLIDIVGAASRELARELPCRSARRRAQVLPCGVDVERFRPLARAEARAELGLDGGRPYLLFPADPGRREKRHDRAQALADACNAELLALGGVDPGRVPLWVNAANAVVVPSEREGFGLAALEGLACDVPVLATPVGIHPEALAGVSGCLCAPFELDRWRTALAPQLDSATEREAASDQAPAGDGVRPSDRRERALEFSAQAMARRVAAAWRTALHRSG